MHTEEEEGGVFDSPFMSHHHALAHVLRENPLGQHMLSHAAGVLHDLIADHMPQSDAELGMHVANLLHKRGIHRHDQMSAEGGSSKARYLELLKQNVKRARISRQLEHDLAWLDNPGLNDEALGAVPLPPGDGVT